MRLVCPKCAAQYEVDSSAIPEAGRDVQCASCGNTWFQKRVTGLRKEHAAPPPPPEPEYEDEYEDEDDQRDPAPQWDASDPDDEEPDPRRPARPQAAAADPSVLDILRREAEHDAAVRRGETADEEPDDDLVEEQPDLMDQSGAEAGDDAPVSRPRSIRSPVAESGERGRRLHLSAGGEGAAPAPDAPIAPKRPERPARPAGDRPGRPDVDALKSSLRTAIASEDAPEDDEDEDYEDQVRGGGGRFGYYLAILLCLVLVAAYALEPQIVGAVPAAAPVLEQYTALVDVARHGLASSVDKLVVLVRGLIGG
ncbi:MAG: zinc-ribbon domain-containing protein [Rhodobacteraceae bacterium]|nr:zinc-ribbon domain-containing protein [Paracoccaceae bacterium]